MYTKVERTVYNEPHISTSEFFIQKTKLFLCHGYSHGTFLVLIWFFVC